MKINCNTRAVCRTLCGTARDWHHPVFTQYIYHSIFTTNAAI